MRYNRSIPKTNHKSPWYRLSNDAHCYYTKDICKIRLTYVRLLGWEIQWLSLIMNLSIIEEIVHHKHTHKVMMTYNKKYNAEINKALYEVFSN